MSDADQNNAPLSRHQTNSAQTRERLLQTAQSLYAARGIDAVSFNEITAAAGQKNRNALQYHFGRRDDLLQAIVDQHASKVYQLRREYLANIADQPNNPAHDAAQVFIMPIADYVANQHDAIEYLNIAAQIAASNKPIAGAAKEFDIMVSKDKDFVTLMAMALKHLKPAVAKRRTFLAVSFAFHGIADIYRSTPKSTKLNQDHKKMIKQLVIGIEALFAAPD